MAKRSYAEKLRDPRWQKKRLEVLSREDFTCEVCGDDETTLHVHHGYYEKGAEPWDYETETLHCLCEECHDYIQERTRQIHREIALFPIYCFSILMEEVTALREAWEFNERHEKEMNERHKREAGAKARG